MKSELFLNERRAVIVSDRSEFVIGVRRRGGDLLNDFSVAQAFTPGK